MKHLSYFLLGSCLLSFATSQVGHTTQITVNYGDPNQPRGPNELVLRNENNEAKIACSLVDLLLNKERKLRILEDKIQEIEDFLDDGVITITFDDEEVQLKLSPECRDALEEYRDRLKKFYKDVKQLSQNDFFKNEKVKRFCESLCHIYSIYADALPIKPIDWLSAARGCQTLFKKLVPHYSGGHGDPLALRLEHDPNKIIEIIEACQQTTALTAKELWTVLNWFKDPLEMNPEQQTILSAVSNAVTAQEELPAEVSSSDDFDDFLNTFAYPAIASELRRREGLIQGKLHSLDFEPFLEEERKRRNDEAVEYLQKKRNSAKESLPTRFWPRSFKEYVTYQSQSGQPITIVVMNGVGDIGSYSEVSFTTRLQPLEIDECNSYYKSVPEGMFFVENPYDPESERGYWHYDNCRARSLSYVPQAAPSRKTLPFLLAEVPKASVDKFVIPFCLPAAWIKDFYRQLKEIGEILMRFDCTITVQPRQQFFEKKNEVLSRTWADGNIRATIHPGSVDGFSTFQRMDIDILNENDDGEYSTFPTLGDVPEKSPDKSFTTVQSSVDFLNREKGQLAPLLGVSPDVLEFVYVTAEVPTVSVDEGGPAFAKYFLGKSIELVDRPEVQPLLFPRNYNHARQEGIALKIIKPVS